MLRASLKKLSGSSSSSNRPADNTFLSLVQYIRRHFISQHEFALCFFSQQDKLTSVYYDRLVIKNYGMIIVTQGMKTPDHLQFPSQVDIMFHSAIRQHVSNN